METHGIHLEGVRKEQPQGTLSITCSDCGHIYLVAADQRSSACTACGNVEFRAGRPLEALSEEIVARRVLPRLGKKVLPGAVDYLEAFRTAPDGKAVEQLHIQFQVEWQLWAALVMHFQDPAYHMAYITAALAENRLEQAAERYREHRSVMALLGDSKWQAEVSDLMLARIENLSVSRMPLSQGDYGFDIPDFLKLLPFDSRLPKVMWIAFGLFLAAKLLHLPPIRP